MADSVATLPSTSSFSSNLITAEIRVENLASSSDSSASTTATISVMPTTTPTQQQAVENISEADNNMPSISKQSFDEPEAKKQKFDTSSKKLHKKLEKLESRLGSVLCCAVCLDLPKTAMYQVSNSFFSYTMSLLHFLLRIKNRHESFFFIMSNLGL